MKHLLAPFLIALAVNTTATIPKDDVVLRALNDELVRSKTKLHLDQYPSPYFLSYTVHQTERLAVVASFGAIDSSKLDRSRTLSSDVRVGDYSLDSSGAGASSVSRLTGGGETITIDDDYEAIRHDLWLSTDSAYKRAVERLASKKAFLQENDIKDRPDSLSKEKPVVDIEPGAHLVCDEKKANELVRKLSAIFKEYPSVRKSMVALDDNATTRWFVNSEGFCNRTPKNNCDITITASAQANDGSIISDSDVMAGEKEADLPTYPEMEKRVRAVADHLTQLVKAEAIEQYRGPILFEKNAAAEFFTEVLQPNLGNTPEGLDKTSQMMGKMNPLSEQIGTRILPAFISVIDDPTAKVFGKSKNISSYAVDDEGVRAQKITLVDKGILKTFAASRAPSREIKQSNGHARGHAGVACNLVIESTRQLKPAELKAALIAMGKEDGLKEVLVVRRLSNFMTAILEPASIISSFASALGGGRSVLLPPVLLYKVSVADGHEQLIRGAEFGGVTMRVLRDIEATGDDSQAYPVFSTNKMTRQGVEANMLVTPSILVKEIELQKPTRQHELPTTLKNPYFEK